MGVEEKIIFEWFEYSWNRDNYGGAGGVALTRSSQKIQEDWDQEFLSYSNTYINDTIERGKEGEYITYSESLGRYVYIATKPSGGRGVMRDNAVMRVLVPQNKGTDSFLSCFLPDIHVLDAGEQISLDDLTGQWTKSSPLDYLNITQKETMGAYIYQVLQFVNRANSTIYIKKDIALGNEMRTQVYQVLHLLYDLMPETYKNKISFSYNSESEKPICRFAAVTKGPNNGAMLLPVSESSPEKKDGIRMMADQLAGYYLSDKKKYQDIIEYLIDAKKEKDSAAQIIWNFFDYMIKHKEHPEVSSENAMKELTDLIYVALEKGEYREVVEYYIGALNCEELGSRQLSTIVPQLIYWLTESTKTFGAVNEKTLNAAVEGIRIWYKRNPNECFSAVERSYKTGSKNLVFGKLLMKLKTSCPEINEKLTKFNGSGSLRDIFESYDANKEIAINVNGEEILKRLTDFLDPTTQERPQLLSNPDVFRIFEIGREINRSRFLAYIQNMLMKYTDIDSLLKQYSKIKGNAYYIKDSMPEAADLYIQKMKSLQPAGDYLDKKWITGMSEMCDGFKIDESEYLQESMVAGLNRKLAVAGEDREAQKNCVRDFCSYYQDTPLARMSAETYYESMRLIEEQIKEEQLAEQKKKSEIEKREAEKKEAEHAKAKENSGEQDEITNRYGEDDKIEDIEEDIEGFQADKKRVPQLSKKQGKNPSKKSGKKSNKKSNKQSKHSEKEAEEDEVLEDTEEYYDSEISHDFDVQLESEMVDDTEDDIYLEKRDKNKRVRTGKHTVDSTLCIFFIGIFFAFIDITMRRLISIFPSNRGMVTIALLMGLAILFLAVGLLGTIGKAKVRAAKVQISVKLLILSVGIYVCLKFICYYANAFLMMGILGCISLILLITLLVRIMRRKA
ncbi:MAG: hypothetical protein EOM40_04985 [Clostridia bacterium]|nr:hypothetical protein [Clostridia bacterium]NCC42099.1 hypothetical protein [Clostridia bacterium]